MTNDELLDKSRELIAIESTYTSPQRLREAYDYVIRFLKDSGKDITIEEFESNGKPSFLAYKGGCRPKKFQLIFNGHLDVVPGKPHQYQPIIKDGKLYGRGAHDMKAACIVMTATFCEFVDKVSFAFGLQIVTDEESAGRHGTLYQIQQGVRCDFVICGECGRSTDVYEIANRAKGIVIAEIGFSGKSVHGAFPWKGNNAAAHAAHFVHTLHERYPIPTEATTDSTITVTAISAYGDAHTATPEMAKVKLDSRFVPGDPYLSNEKGFTSLIKELDPNAEILDYHDFSSALYTSPDNPQLRMLKAAAEKVEGHPFQFVQRNGTSDGRFYGDVGNSACEFGIAGEHQHGDEENISLAAFVNYRKTLRTFMAMESSRANEILAHHQARTLDYSENF